MRDLRSRANLQALGTTEDRLKDISPTLALQECLDRAYAYMLFYANEAAKLPESEIWRDTLSGKIPHETIRAERDARAEVAYLAGRALDIGIEEKKVQLAEAAAAMIANLVESVMDEVGLTADQRKRVGPAIRHQLSDIDGEAKPATSPAALPAGRKVA